ncbi:hypothetical protein BN2497_2119 [Janthinobacterium sp. CG23_2]|nr:hypothetical protein BN2497_2119 [Janthinobacterium sp. CG23_2]CUU27457.1 hypothetical protein BN3177_2119 [Janthinobacterium sp. CG23_2]
MPPSNFSGVSEEVVALQALKVIVTSRAAHKRTTNFPIHSFNM